MIIADCRPSSELAAVHRESGVWRDTGPLSDLRRWRGETPEATAIVAYRADGGTQRLTYAEYALHVERFAGALRSLGVGPGQVVAFQLPNLWQVPVLLMACARVGAIAAPVMTSFRPRELERMLARLDVTVCVTVDSWEGFEHAEQLAKMAPRLPRLRHRVVLGDVVSDGEVPFAPYFQQTPWERLRPMPLDDADNDPDRVAVILFTSGTSGSSKGVLHSCNTFYAGAHPVVAEEGFGPGEKVFTPQALTHVMGGLYGIHMPLLSGACSVIMDKWDPDDAVAVLAESSATVFVATPSLTAALVDAARRSPRDLSALRFVVSGGTQIPGRLAGHVLSVLGAPLRAVWGMTEVPGHTWTRADDPVDWSAHSDGRPGPGLEIDLRGEREGTVDRPARLFVRGGGVALAILGRDDDSLRMLADHDNGWFDTGDLAVPDGRGGIRICGRTADRISGPGGAMIPVSEVEAQLLDLPGIDDVAMIGYQGGNDGELPCAVLVSSATAPSLAEVRAYLTGQGTTDWFQPSRIEVVTRLPRTALGKINRDVLRRWLNGETEYPAN